MSNSLFLWPHWSFSFFFFIPTMIVFILEVLFCSFLNLLGHFRCLLLLALWFHSLWVARVNLSKTDSLKVGLLEEASLASWKAMWKPAMAQCLWWSILVNLKAWPVALWPYQGMGCTSSSINTELTELRWSQSSATSYCYYVSSQTMQLKAPQPMVKVLFVMSGSVISLICAF